MLPVFNPSVPQPFVVSLFTPAANAAKPFQFSSKLSLTEAGWCERCQDKWYDEDSGCDEMREVRGLIHMPVPFSTVTANKQHVRILSSVSTFAGKEEAL